MSIFDPTSGMNPMPWLMEKTLVCLRDAVGLVDLANEPDTAPYYAKALRHRASLLIGRLAPIVALVHGAGEEAASHKEWDPIIDKGSFALAHWCKKWQVADPREIGLLAEPREDIDDDDAANDTQPEPPEKGGTDLELELTLATSIAGKLLHEDLPEGARRLLLWLVFHLRFTDRPGVVAVSRKFLPTDIGCSPEDTASGYKLLHDRGLIERVAASEHAKPEALFLRLVIEGVNESKAPAPFQEVEFGFPGARLQGRPTIGNHLLLALPPTTQKSISRWTLSADDLRALRDELQKRIGPDQMLVEEVTLWQNEGEQRLDVRARYPMDAEDRVVTAVLERLAADWLRGRLVKSGEVDGSPH